MSLNDIKDGDLCFAPSQELFHDVTTQESTAAHNEIGFRA
jgi:hypothetical protein